MRFPTLNEPKRTRTTVSRFLGYEHLSEVRPGAFYEMQNLTGANAPELSVRPRRLTSQDLGGVLALSGGQELAVLCSDGSLRCGEHVLNGFLLTQRVLIAECSRPFAEVTVDREAVLAVCDENADYAFVYDAANSCWRMIGAETALPASAFTYYKDQPQNDDVVLVHIFLRPADARPKRLVRMGGFMIAFPDGRYVNLVRLTAGETLVADEDYGSIELRNACSEGELRFAPCTLDGEEYEITRDDTAPEDGWWIDTSEPEPTLKKFSQSQGVWTEAARYVKCCIPGIARGLQEGGGVELAGAVPEALRDLWRGSHLLYGVYRDPGASGRAAGTNDWVILAGALDEEITLTLTGSEQTVFVLRRPLPEMDFVVECQNRLWGCKSGGGVNELYGSKLGDFRSWSSFAGLSTDSYRASRGDPGPYTGAAVLGGCPLFFREDSVEKLYPSASGAHGIVTLSLSGVEQGSADSLRVIRDKLYYKSREGICCYAGTLPTCVSRALGTARYHGASAGTLGSRYYVSMLDENGAPTLFVLDTDTGLWFREDATALGQTAEYDGKLWFTQADGSVRIVDPNESTAGVRWSAETGDLLPALQTKRYVSRVQLRLRLEPNAAARIYASRDGGPWEYHGEVLGSRRGSRVFAFLPRRCETLRLRLEGVGGMRLESLSYLTEAGSDE